MADPKGTGDAAPSLSARMRQCRDADAAARKAEAAGDAAQATALWAHAIDATGLVPESLKVQRQAVLFPATEAELYEGLLDSDSATLPTLVAHFRYGHLAARYDWQRLCALLAQALPQPAAELLWRELLAKSPQACALALAMRPDDADVVCASARHDIDAGQLEPARDRLAAFVQNHPAVDLPRRLLQQVEAGLLSKEDYVQRRMEAADALIDEGCYDLALAEIRFARRHGSETPAALVKAAWCLSELGQLDDACRMARRAIELEPESADAHLALGSVLRKLGQLQSAAEQLDRCAELAPADSPLRFQAQEIASHAYSDLGEAAYLAGELSDASRLFEQTLVRNPAHPHALQRMARLAELCKDYTTAADLWQRLASVGQEQAAWRMRVCALLADGADEAMLNAAERCANNGEVRWADEIIRSIDNPQLREQNELFESIPAAVDELNDECGRAWERIGSGDYLAAKKRLERVKPICPNDPRILRGLGFALAAEAQGAFAQARLELVAQAIDALKQAIAVDPTTEDAQAARNKLDLLGA